jgi:hypothetical protein
MPNKIAVNSRQLQARLHARTGMGVLLLIRVNLRIMLARFEDIVLKLARAGTMNGQRARGIKNDERRRRGTSSDCI